MTTTTPTVMHPVVALLRDLRQAARLSLQQVERKFDIPAVVLGSWERGDRRPTVDGIQRVLDVYGWELVAQPRDRTRDGGPTVRTPAQNAAILRAIADQLDPEDQAEPEESPDTDELPAPNAGSEG